MADSTVAAFNAGHYDLASKAAAYLLARDEQVGGVKLSDRELIVVAHEIARAELIESGGKMSKAVIDGESLRPSDSKICCPL